MKIEGTLDGLISPQVNADRMIYCFVPCIYVSSSDCPITIFTVEFCMLV